jgi:hypothetical protein
LLARAGFRDGASAIAELSGVLREHDVVISLLVMSRSQADGAYMEIRIDASFPGQSLSGVLLDLLGCESVEVLSAESLGNRSTFILPI